VNILGKNPSATRSFRWRGTERDRVEGGKLAEMGINEFVSGLSMICGRRLGIWLKVIILCFQI
jgi:hypothetical protein